MLRRILFISFVLELCQSQAESSYCVIECHQEASLVSHDAFVHASKSNDIPVTVIVTTMI